ncbi:MAG: hypothetical protein KGZ60_06975 [Truepera sp.]|nr:hypothetical protein [Truepera sp.]
MTLSREARIIIGIVFVAVAAWLWINYFTQAGEPVGAELPAPAAPATVAPPVVARELTIAQLPFLVTAAPEVAVEVVAPVEEVLIARPGDQRAAINPFSPIIVRAAPAPATPTPAIVATTPPPPIEVANIPITPTPQPPPVVSAPVPRPLAPPPPVADNLPRALPSGTLPLAPSILRQARTAPPGPANLAEVVAIRVPEATIELPPGLTPEAQAAPATTPLRPLAPTPAVALQATPPLSAGANPLARYLRDQNVTFTGSVLGPIGVGVFRSNLTLAPVVVALGQPLPDTDIVLKGLRGQEAVFSQGNHSETLVLNLRR